MPAGCTFDGDIGVLTCVSTATTTHEHGPTTFVGAPTSTELAPGFTALDWCNDWATPAPWKRFTAFNLVVTQETTATTTTIRHGLRGKLMTTDVATSVGNSWQSTDFSMCTTST